MYGLFVARCVLVGGWQDPPELADDDHGDFFHVQYGSTRARGHFNAARGGAHHCRKRLRRVCDRGSSALDGNRGWVPGFFHFDPVANNCYSLVLDTGSWSTYERWSKITCLISGRVASCTFALCWLSQLEHEFLQTVGHR